MRQTQTDTYMHSTKAENKLVWKVKGELSKVKGSREEYWVVDMINYIHA